MISVPLTMSFIPIGRSEAATATLTELKREGEYVVAVFTPDWHLFHRVSKERWVSQILARIQLDSLLGDREYVTESDYYYSPEEGALFFVIKHGK